MSKRRHFGVITSKWRRIDVMTTLLLHHVFRGSNAASIEISTNLPSIWVVKFKTVCLELSHFCLILNDVTYKYPKPLLLTEIS